MPSTQNNLVWYFMVTTMSILIIGGGAWASNVNQKIERIASLEISIDYIKNDISDIKFLIKNALK